MASDIGDRFKRYERASDLLLTPRSSVIIRVDGRAFHTFTRDCEKPFDSSLMTAMSVATRNTAAEMAGFKLAYTQSDEASFLITDTDTLNTQGWFGYSHSKLVSITASTFTMYFNKAYQSLTGKRNAVFDARAFVVPSHDAPNYFVWRQQDWLRNSLRMLAQGHFTHSQLHKKNSAHIHDMLHTKGLNWAHLSDWTKNGRYILRNGEQLDRTLDYATLDELIDEVADR